MATSPQLPAEARANAKHCRAVASYIDVFLVRRLQPFMLVGPSAWGAKSREVHETSMAKIRTQLGTASRTLLTLADSYDRWARQLDQQIAFEQAQAEAQARAQQQPTNPSNPFSPFG
jgi:hypothetical protein